MRCPLIVTTNHLYTEEMRLAAEPPLAKHEQVISVQGAGVE
jgi:hypothetical protein